MAVSDTANSVLIGWIRMPMICRSIKLMVYTKSKTSKV